MWSQTQLYISNICHLQFVVKLSDAIQNFESNSAIVIYSTKQWVVKLSVVIQNFESNSAIVIYSTKRVQWVVKLSVVNNSNNVESQTQHCPSVPSQS